MYPIPVQGLGFAWELSRHAGRGKTGNNPSCLAVSGLLHGRRSFGFYGRLGSWFPKLVAGPHLAAMLLSGSAGMTCLIPVSADSNYG